MLGCVAAVCSMVLVVATCLPTPRHANTNNNIPLNLHELAKLGITTEDLLAQIKQLAEGKYGCGFLNVADMTRHYINNKTVTCNDGSMAG